MNDFEKLIIKNEIMIKTLKKISDSHNYDFYNWKHRGDVMKKWCSNTLNKIKGIDECGE